jgi:hypothetical protein
VIEDDDVPNAYPLQWPIGRKRTRAPTRATFNERGRPLSFLAARDRLLYELDRAGATQVVISSNATGSRGSFLCAADQGVAVYFRLVGNPHCLSCDRWDRLPDNLAAIAKHCEAIRGQLRWGAADVEQAYAGFKSLPAVLPWWRVLGFERPPGATDLVSQRFRELAQKFHPDRPGGSHDKMAEISAAYKTGLAETTKGSRP